ncbi:hypothetical protein F4553_000070 [Allocatelliglobosispora scoriae]|uniref:TIR domain-containing protein n=1 Tax=Allocatelliglobosispora scoriae TaxID=643052 RepID=A0A841BIG6_9ACTN|nr:toll/interleukin-1 receptor domain-containing protein [Allocatelliglobosispora scoriae]MBB5866691.1 hypothetical protein [Allocatelliglobosispora scoriae]
MAGHVFISYSRTDHVYANRLADHVARAGLPVWLDNAIATGETFGPRIQQAIDECAVFVVVLTPESARSDWVRREVSRAARLRKPMRPLLLRPCDVPIELDGIHHEDVTRGEMPSRRFTDELRTTGTAPDPVRAVPVIHAVRRPRRTALLLVAGLLVVAMGVTAGVLLLNRAADSTPEVPLVLTPLDRVSPGCDEGDPEVTWTVVGATKTCGAAGTTLTKLRSWTEPPGLGFAELRFAVKGHRFPSSYTVTFTVADLSDPVAGNNGGCASVFVHTTSDGTTFEQLDICGSGLHAIVRWVNLTDVGRQTQAIPSGLPEGESGRFTVVATVTGDRAIMRVANPIGASDEITSSPAVNATTAYVSLVMAWRNAGAKATFSNFHYSTTG